MPCVELGWTRTDAATICATRTDGAVEQLRRVLGDEPDGLDRVNELLARAVEPLRPEGRALYAGLRVPRRPRRSAGGDVAARRHAARVPRRQPHRGVGVRRARRHRDRTADRAVLGPAAAHLQPDAGLDDEQFDAATERLESRGLDRRRRASPSRAGELREDIEVHTDAQMRPALDALGDDVDELCDLLAPWGERSAAAKGYPAAGPHDLARTASSRGRTVSA